MSIPDLPPAPLKWENQPSTATPFDAEVLNPWGEAVMAGAAASRDYAVEARQAAVDAETPTEQMVANVLATNYNLTSLLAYSEHVIDNDWSAALAIALDDLDDVTIPPGTYDIDQVTIPEGKTLHGGPGVVLRLRDDAVTGLTVRAHATLRDLTIDGNSAGQSATNQVIISVTGQSARLEQIEIIDGLHKAVMVHHGADYTRIDSCTVRDSGVLNSCDAFSIKASHVTVTNCHVYRQGNGHAFRTGRHNFDPQIPTEHVVFDSCTVHDSEHNGFTIEMDSANIVIANCSVKDAPQAVKGEFATRVTVNGCTFKDIALSTAFNMAAVTHGIYQGNTLTRAGGGILAGDHSTITGNILDTIENGSQSVYGIRANGPARIEGNILRHIKGVPIHALAGGAAIIGNIVEACDNTISDHQILAGSSALPSGLIVQGNTVKDPTDSSGSRTVTAISLQGNRATLTGNVLVGAAARGLRIVSGSNYYVARDNVMSDAAEPVADGGGQNKSVGNNI